MRDGAAVDATDTFSWTVTNTNQDPTFDQNLGDRTDAEGDLISLDAGATDADGDTLTYAATGLPAGLSIDTDHRRDQRHHQPQRRQRQPLRGQRHRERRDRHRPTDTFSWTVTNTNQTPTFDQHRATAPTPKVTVISLDAGATDPDGDTLTYAATGLPGRPVDQPATGVISGTISSAPPRQPIQRSASPSATAPRSTPPTPSPGR